MYIVLWILVYVKTVVFRIIKIKHVWICCENEEMRQKLGDNDKIYQETKENETKRQSLI